ncbi:ribonucleotide-diphosphate reductase subunit alpha, partial [Candidatus Bathyarchaeota archaeon]|nr:ribonucleotide-diphosphate reductase subunit alpha [Candidatus Bathyarchaeota archaeon]
MVIRKIRKRDGRVVDFDPSRIRDAIHRAFIAVELEDGEKAEALTKEVVKLLEERFKRKIPSVEDAQDAVIEVLRKRGYKQVAEEYESYREKKADLRKRRKRLEIEPKKRETGLKV